MRWHNTISERKPGDGGGIVKRPFLYEDERESNGSEKGEYSIGKTD